MDGSFLKGIEYPLFAGLGALVGLFVGAPIMALLAIVWPDLWGWIFAPCGAGAAIGFIFAGFLK